MEANRLYLVEVVIFPNRRAKVAKLLDLIGKRKTCTYAYSDSSRPTVATLVSVPVLDGKLTLRGMILSVSEPSSIEELVEQAKEKGLDPSKVVAIDSTYRTASPTSAELYLQGIIYKRLSKGLAPWESLNSIK